VPAAGRQLHAPNATGMPASGRHYHARAFVAGFDMQAFTCI